MGSLSRLGPFLWAQKWPLAVGFLFMVVQNWGFAQVPEYLRRALDELSHGNRKEVLLSHLLLALVFMLVTAAGMFFMRKLIIGASRHIEYALRQTLFEKLMRLDFSFYRNQQTGDLISRTTGDLDHVRTLLGPGIMYIPNSLSRLAFFIPAMVALSPGLTLGLLTVVVVLVVVIVVVLPKLRPLYQAVQEKTGGISSRVYQVLTGLVTLRLHRREQIEAERFDGLSRDFLNANMKLGYASGWTWPFFFAVFSGTELLILAVGGREVISGTMTLGMLLKFSVMMGVLTFPILSLGWVMTMVQQGVAAMNRVRLILDAEELKPRTRSTWSNPEPGPLTFSFDHLTFHHGASSRPALADFTAHIGPGETIGITGPVGSGKSTLVGLLTGTLHPEPGMIRVGTHDLADVDPAFLHEQIAYVPQEAFLFSMSIRENIALGPDPVIDEDRLEKAVALAQLSDEIRHFPMGLDTVVGEKGMTLSGGQRQRVALARAFYRGGNLMVLDDSLSAVDSRTETAILSALREIKNRQPLILVSHRASALRLCDRLLVLDDGRLVEQGNPMDLAGSGGLFSRLVELQKLQDSLAPSGTEPRADIGSGRATP